ncbi:MAG: dienelactone hydrolase family protein [Bdellovibrionaceae bacterium]|nr:dienelactone hydrolase family protein [Pseudobdellovibrionaceae bacterium]
MVQVIALFILIWMAGVSQAEAKLVSQTVSYKQGGVELEGYLSYDDSHSAAGARPGVLVVHDWLGLTEKTKKRADALAQLGYIAFAADIYGKGVRPANQDAAAKEAGKYRSGDRKLLRERAKAALKALGETKGVDKNRLAAIGYCFGGGAVLELARTGADVKAVVSFHGNLDTPAPANAKTLKAHVLALHGADDPFVPAEQVNAFETEMRSAKADWSLIKYGNSVHSFTDETAGTDPSQGQAYNPTADKRSWEAMQDFFKETL